MSERSKRWRWFRRLTLGVLAALAVLLTVAVVDGWVAFGHQATGARRQRMEASPQYADGVFRNPQPLWNDVWGSMTGVWSASSFGSPQSPLPVVQGAQGRFDAAPPSGLRVTWLGHSTSLVEIDGATILTDPVWGPRSSPLSWVGPERWYAPPLSLRELPKIDAVVLSHDHYDHLDYPTIVAILELSAETGWDAPFIMPLGVGAHLAYWGVPAERIIELDWWEHTMVGDLEIVCTPARHASGRTLFDQDATLWAGYALRGPAHRVYFSGDTGLFPAMTDIGERLGPFDLTMIEVGAYGQAWPDWHLGPEQAVRAHQMVGGEVLLPIHWGLFNLAFHGWTEPIERVQVAAAAAEVTVVTPRPGQSLEPTADITTERWWPDVPWKTAAQIPIVATRVD